MGETTLRISDELAEELAKRKQRGDSYEAVIWRLLDADPGDAGDSPPPAAETDSETRAGGTERRGSGRDTAPTQVPTVSSMSFERELTFRHIAVLEKWLVHVRDNGRVQKSDLEAWYADTHRAQTGCGAGEFWDCFAEPALRQADPIARPDSYTYVWEDSG